MSIISPAEIENEELNSLLTTIKNQDEELEMKDKEIEKLQHMLAKFEKEKKAVSAAKPVAEKTSAAKKTASAKSKSAAKATSKKTSEKTPAKDSK